MYLCVVSTRKLHYQNIENAQVQASVTWFLAPAELCPVGISGTQRRGWAGLQWLCCNSGWLQKQILQAGLRGLQTFFEHSRSSSNPCKLKGKREVLEVDPGLCASAGLLWMRRAARQFLLLSLLCLSEPCKRPVAEQQRALWLFSCFWCVLEVFCANLLSQYSHNFIYFLFMTMCH